MILSISTYAYNSTKEIEIIEAVIFASIILISFSIIIKFVAKIHIMSILLILLCLISLAVYLVYDVKSLVKDNKGGGYILINVLLYTDIFRKLMNIMTLLFEKVMNKDDTFLANLKDVNDELEKGFKEVKKNFGKEDSDEEDDDDSDEKKSKGKDKKGKKGKKDDKSKKDKGKKGGKEKKDDKGKKGKGKKDKKDDKKDKKKKKKSKKSDDDDDDEDDLFNKDNTKKIAENLFDLFGK